MQGKILVTGGLGYIGSHFVRFLLSGGFDAKDIIVFDNCAEEKVLPEGVIFYSGNVRNKGDLERVFLENSVKAVVHFAAFISVEESVSDPGLYFRSNVFGTLNLLECMAENGVDKIVFSSTAAVFGAPEKMPITEDFEKKPESPYGMSKLMAEKLIESYGKTHGIKYVIFRYFNAAGADFGIGEDHQPETHLIPLVLRAALSGRKISVFGDDYNTFDGTCVRDYIHVLDLARAHLMALDYLSKGGESNSFNLGTGKGTSILEIIREIENICGKIDYEIKEKRSGDVVSLIADFAKARDILGWMPEKNLSDIIKSAYLWEKRRVLMSSVDDMIG